LAIGTLKGEDKVKALRRLASCVAAVGLVATSGCAGAGSLGASANEVTIALVSNSQMTDAQK
jgi:sorbitol/mannitol transport system substrate-binding protein